MDWGHQPNTTSLSSHLKKDEHECESEMDEEEDDNATDDAMYQGGNSSLYYVQQMTPAEYQKQATNYTKAAVQNLISSPEYQRVYTRCQLCWCSWSEGQFSADCHECGGFAMSRPCPICHGKCGATWTREVDMSHSNYHAHWDGDCRLPLEEKQGYLFQLFMAEEGANESDIIDGMNDL